MMQDTLKISKKTFLTSIAILFVLMLLAGALTQVVPQGSFERVVEDGREVVLAGSYREDPDANVMAFWNVLVAPFMVLVSEDAMTVVGILLFLVLVSGAIGCLQSSGIMAYAVSKIERRYQARKYRLLWGVTGLFMVFGSAIGCFEECAALVPMAVALAIGLGWDSLVGLGMSLLACGFGFAAAVFNPFTLGVAQKMAGLPLYSGLWFHVLCFFVVYVLLAGYLTWYAKRLDRDRTFSYIYKEEKTMQLSSEKWQQSEAMDRGLRVFLVALGVMVAVILAGLVLPAVSGLSIPLVALSLAVGGFVAAASAQGAKEAGRTFGKSIVGMLPAVLMILMASSIKWIIVRGGILDTILYRLSEWVAGAPPLVCLLLIYGIVLVMNFFIASGSAKAFLLMPLLVPLADLVGVTRQAMIVAFCFGDGFSNVFYPTNPVLLICLGMTAVNYGKWVKFTWKMQGLVLIASSILLALAYFVQIGPF